jgi:hypothetical protein
MRREKIFVILLSEAIRLNAVKIFLPLARKPPENLHAVSRAVKQRLYSTILNQ